VYAAGRTDAGVHAKGQVINFKTKWTTPIDRVCRAINSGGLPKDIVVKLAEEVDMEFHSRYSAREKTYKYYVYNNEISNPFWHRYSLFVPQALNVELMREGLSYLIGYHEFTSFKAYGSSVKSDWRTIYEFTFRGDGFLYNMVRIIVGTIIMVGRGKISPGRLAEILIAKDRNLAGKTAPPQGLFLEKVDY
jgi:tRNA pseudouridine38-40 synthase